MTVSRRNFLRGLALGVGGTAVAGTARASTVQEFKGHPGRYGVLHDTTLCVGCRSCEVACRVVNTLPAIKDDPNDKSVFDKKRRVDPGSFTVVNRHEVPGHGAVYRKEQCMHCNEPCCATVCLVRAFSKTPEGPVLYDPDVCIGCRYCVMACPYYALSYEYDNVTDPKVLRCTMCYPRLKEGKSTGCAEACPTGALTFGRREDLVKVARARITKSPERYLDHLFGLHEFGGTSWLVLSGASFGSLGLHENVTSTSLPEIGTAFLGVVPLVITIYPGLLAGFYAFSKRKEQLSKEQAQAAVVEALMKADEGTKEKLAAAAKRATKDKEQAIASAVKKALEEVKAQEKAQEKAKEPAK
jgi:Fe-S-cluster-containing dehydrogenase component